MSTAAGNAATLSRRSSIHSSVRPSNHTAPTRQFSTLEIEVEYISTNQLPIGGIAAYRNSLNAVTDIELSKEDDNNATLNRVVEEEEEEEVNSNSKTTQRTAAAMVPQSQGRAPSIPRPSARPYPPALPRPRPLRPQSQQYPAQTWQQPEPEDHFARVYQPTDMGLPRSTLPLVASRQAGTARHSVGGYLVHTSVSHNEYLQSTHVQHDSTPVLSSTGSQSDEDEDEVDDEMHSPVNCLVVESEDEKEAEDGAHGESLISDKSSSSVEEQGTPEGTDYHQDHLPTSQEPPQTPEIETQETLRRERTRILERTVVSTYREISYKDISNIQPLKRGGYGEIHTAEWSRLRVVLKRALPGHTEGVEQFDQELEILKRVHDYDFIVPFYGRFPQKRPIYSAECDIYSLGVIFWHISSGRIPFAKRLREPILLKELMDGHREEIVPGTPREYRDLLVKCWDKKPSRRLKIDVVIAILQTLMAKPSEPVHQIATGFAVPSESTSAALPIPPEFSARLASLERASNALNRMVFDIQDDMMRETVNYIERTRAYFAEQRMPPEPYSPSNPPKTPIYLCQLVGDLAALSYYLSRGRPSYNPINESSAQTGDTALHLACLFLESPMDTIKILVELGADINLENLQGYTPVMILVSSNTQYCYEALRFFVRRGARIPAYIRNPITPLNSAQIYALNLVNESRQIRLSEHSVDNNSLQIAEGRGGPATTATTVHARQDRRRSRQQMSLQNQHVYQERGGHRVDRVLAQGRPLIHVVAAMQEDYRILDCLCEAGLDPAISFGGETALVAAAAHLRIKNVEWLLNHDLDISSEAGVQRAIKVVKMLHHFPFSTTHPYAGIGNGLGHGKAYSCSSGVKGRLHVNSTPTEFPDDIRDLGKYSWAGVTFGEADRLSKDMVGPVLNLLEQWTGSRRIANRKEVATKLKVMYGSSMEPSAPHQGLGSFEGPMASSSTSVASSSSQSSTNSQGSNNLQRQNQSQNQSQSQSQSQSQAQAQRYSQQSHQSSSHARGGALVHGTKSLRKSQRHLVDQVLSEKPSLWFR
ncbi:hypothetical protein KVV02_006623 [Mortierella alpina]|uniref:Protein kinase domain-containing protein n=1 Tax=Mortierella alpina TaxID=64518 RepID=A0A9P8A8W9_MORAP|nr:hypothetical protein KVV02_006623 [Mortierella alpina]